MNRKVTQSPLPVNSRVRKFLPKAHYEDTFTVSLQKKELAIEDIYLRVFLYSPKWITHLLHVRNKIVNVFGITTSIGEMKKENVKAGKKTGIFKIYAIYKNELIAGEDENHLNFRVSVLKDGDKLTISTLVKINNWLGKIYFFIVKPFHKIVVVSMIKNAVKNKRI